jgi:hypothetical protein
MKKHGLTREEMIEVLVEDRLSEWVFASNYGTLEELLWAGFKGYGEYTNDELLEEIELRGLDIEQLQAQLKWRMEEDRKREEDEKKGIYKDPFE